MSAPQKFDLDDRLEAYFATLQHCSLREALKRSVANWHLYAAVTGSALAMATSASAAMMVNAVGDSVAPANVIADERPPASFRDVPIRNAIRLALSGRGSGVRTQSVRADVANRTAPALAPSIAAGGVVPIFSTVNIIQSGEWVSIYGFNLAAETTASNGDFPTALAGTSVEIDGKPAYLDFVSPGQINLQAPDDITVGPVSVVVKTAGGSATSTVTLSLFAPSFSLLDSAYVCGIILRPNGGGAFGKGTYDVLGPTGNSFGYPTVAAAPGDTVELFGVGFGPTSPAVAAGAVFTGAAPVNSDFSLSINGIVVTPSFVGLSSAGLYQINLVVPSGLGEGEVPIQAMVGGMQTQPGVWFSLQSAAIIGLGGTSGGYAGGVGAGFVGGTNPGNTFGNGGGTNGGNAGGTGGGSGGGGGTDAFHKRKPYTPKLIFPSK